MQSRFRPTKKQTRHDAMIKIINEGRTRTQEELKRALQKLGFQVTQSSLSRDISELGLIKQHGRYVMPSIQSTYSQGPMPIVTAIESAGSNMLVVKTLAGMASPVAISIDNHRISHIIGTLAGDDTVFIATGPGASHDLIKKNIKKIFKGEKQ